MHFSGLRTGKAAGETVFTGSGNPVRETPDCFTIETRSGRRDIMAADYAALKKGGFMRQKQKNHFSLRLRVVGGTLTAVQLAQIASVSETYGHGYVHLTSRQGVEIPFIRLDQIDAVKEALEEGGVVPGVCGPRVRTITACQGEAICPGGCIDTYALAQELDERYFGRELPHKFKFGITGCQNNCLKAEENDVGIKGGIRVKWIPDTCIRCGVCAAVCRCNAITIEGGNIHVDQDACNYCGRCTKSCPADSWEETHGYIVSFGGTFGNQISKGTAVIPFIEDHDKLIAVCDAAIGFFGEHAKSGERFRAAIDRIGQEEFNETIRRAYMSTTAYDDTIDITDVVCPVTFVKAKAALEELDDGQVLAVHMNEGEPVQNVPRSFKEEGQQVLKLENHGDGTFTLYVRKTESEE